MIPYILHIVYLVVYYYMFVFTNSLYMITLPLYHNGNHNGNHMAIIMAIILAIIMAMLM